MYMHTSIHKHKGNTRGGQPTRVTLRGDEQGGKQMGKQILMLLIRIDIYEYICIPYYLYQYIYICQHDRGREASKIRVRGIEQLGRRNLHMYTHPYIHIHIHTDSSNARERQPGLVCEASSDLVNASKFFV